jgi:hypothetical protein
VKAAPPERAETRLALATALWDASLDRSRAVEIAQRARDEFAESGSDRGRDDAAAWLVAHRR